MALDDAQREAIRRRVAGWRDAEAREREERRREAPLSGEQALSFALELWELRRLAFEAPDSVREREVEGARAAWAKLRERLAWEATRHE